MAEAQALLTTWRRFSGSALGRRLFSFWLGRRIPYSGSVGARIEELSPGFARVSLLDRRRVRNHLRSVHAVALANLGELATGLALNVGLPADARGILVRLEVRYLKKARGRLGCSCRVEPPASSTEADYPVRASIVDEAGDEVAAVEALWRVGPKRRG